MEYFEFFLEQSFSMNLLVRHLNTYSLTQGFTLFLFRPVTQLFSLIHKYIMSVWHIFYFTVFTSKIVLSYKQMGVVSYFHMLLSLFFLSVRLSVCLFYVICMSLFLFWFFWFPYLSPILFSQLWTVCPWFSFVWVMTPLSIAVKIYILFSLRMDRKTNIAKKGKRQKN